jgi:hypothetical protein
MSTNLADLPELRLSATPKESPIRERHEFGRGIVRELAKYLYESPKSASSHSSIKKLSVTH